MVERGKAREQSHYYATSQQSRETAVAYHGQAYEPRGSRESSVSYYGTSSGRGQEETPSHVSGSRGTGGYPAGSRGVSESDRAYYSRGRGDYSR